MRIGIYFSQTTKEVASVVDDDVLPGSEWLHVTDETRLGLLAIRELLVDRGLVDDPAAVYWYMPQPDEEPLPPLGCDVTTPERRHEGLSARLREAIRRALRRPRTSPQRGAGR